MSFDWSPPQNWPLHKINRLQALIFPSSGALGPVGLEQERAGVDGHGGGAAGGSLRGLWHWWRPVSAARAEAHFSVLSLLLRDHMLD